MIWKKNVSFDSVINIMIGDKLRIFSDHSVSYKFQTYSMIGQYIEGCIPEHTKYLCIFLIENIITSKFL